MPWMVKHAAYLLNRYAVHADGNTSYHRGQTVPYMLPTTKHRPKMEARFFQAIWLGKDTSTNENSLGITKQIVKARTIRRQTKPEKYNKQMMDIIDSTPMTTPTPTSFVVLPARLAVSNKQETSTAEPQTQQAPELPILRSSQQTSTPTITDVPMATSPTTYNRRTPLPIPTTAKQEWQMTSQKPVQQSNHGRDNNTRQHRGRKQRKNQTRPDSERRRLLSQQNVETRSKQPPTKTNKN